MAVLSPGTVMKSSGQRPPTENTVSGDTVLFPLYPPPPRVQEPAMFDRGTRGRFLRTPVPLNLTAEPGVGSCAQPWVTPYRVKKIFRRVAPRHACPLLSHS